MERLHSKLYSLDGRNYKGYKDIQGWTVEFDRFSLSVDHVQGDPYAAPSRLRAFVPLNTSGVTAEALKNKARSTATRDFLARSFRKAAQAERDFSIDSGLQTVLERTACLLNEDTIEIRFRLDLPGRGRQIMGRRAANLLCRVLPEIVDQALIAPGLDLKRLEHHCQVVEDQEALRAQLGEHGLLAFVADNSSLPRRSGVDDKPAPDAILFDSPESLRVTLTAPNIGEVSGLGFPRGITLIVGGGFHGKSTLLKALENGVYNHIPGDGREGVVTEDSAVKIRAEDGRSVSGVDISDFIGSLPGGRTTQAFSTDLASGSTSQAAALVEALEVGAKTILLDEDTSATNFMIRDQRMQALVAKTSEPITPFLDRIRELRDTLEVSTVLVMGGSGDYFDHADTVIQMDAYRPLDVTADAKTIAKTYRTGRSEEHAGPLTPPNPRMVSPGSIKPERKPGFVKIMVRGVDTLVVGRTDVDLRAVEQLVDPCQLRSIGWILARLSKEKAKTVDPLSLVRQLSDTLTTIGWDSLTGNPDGDLALPRASEVMAALNRLRGAKML